MQHWKGQVVTVSGKGVVLLGNHFFGHFSEARRCNTHLGVENPCKIGLFVVSKLKADLRNRLFAV